MVSHAASSSHHMEVRPSIGMPKIRSSHLNPLTNSTASFMAANSDPNVDVSTEFYFLEQNMIGALLTKINVPD